MGQNKTNDEKRNGDGMIKEARLHKEERRHDKEEKIILETT